MLSETFGLLENLFRTQNDCYLKCDLKNRATLFNVDACKKGCDYKLHNGNCENKCRSFSIDQQIQASCLSGCSPINLEPTVPIDNQALRSIILIHLRQRPSTESSSMNFSFLPILMNIKNQLNANKNWIEQTNKIPSNILNDEKINKMKNSVNYDTEQIKPVDTESKQFMNNSLNQWNDLARQYPMKSAWLCFSLILVLCTFLWCMIVSICRRMPRFQTLSMHNEKLAIDNIYEKQYQYKEFVPTKY